MSQRATQGRRTALVDPTVVLLQLAFYLVFGVSVWRYLRSRGPLELSVVAVFGGFVALFLLSFINGAAPALTPYVRWALIALLYAQPYLVLRLVDQIEPVSPLFSRLVLLGAVYAVAALLAAPGQLSATIPAIGYFFLAQSAAATRFAVVSRRRFGMARIRLALASVATALFGGAILIAGLGTALAAGGTSSPIAQQASRLAALLAALGYLAAFVPPRWLRGFAYKAVAFDLTRSLVAPPVGTDTMSGPSCSAASSLTSQLDTYNNGGLCTPNCHGNLVPKEDSGAETAPTPESSTWGNIKGTYR